MNEVQSPRVKKETKPTLRGKWESVFIGKHKDNVPEETHVVSVMTRKLLETVAKVRDEKDDRLLLHPFRRQNRLTARDKQREESSLDKSEIPCRYKHGKNPSCRFGHPPVCQNYKSETGCKFGRTCFLRHVEAKGKPSKKSKRGGAKGSVASLKESTQLG